LTLLGGSGIRNLEKRCPKPEPFRAGPWGVGVASKGVSNPEDVRTYSKDDARTLPQLDI